MALDIEANTIPGMLSLIFNRPHCYLREGDGYNYGYSIINVHGG